MKQVIMIFDFRNLWDTLYQPVYDILLNLLNRDPLDFEIELVFDEVVKTAFCRLHHYQPNMYPDSFYVDDLRYPELLKTIYSSMGPMIEQQLMYWMRGENAFPLDKRCRYKVLVTPETLIVVRLSSWQIATT